MRHRVQGRKLGRTTAHRISMLRNLVTSLLDNEFCITTIEKAKEVRPLAERMITLGKRETIHARRRALAVVRDKEVVKKVFSTYSSRYAARNGGYTRIYHLSARQGDGAEMAMIELVDRPIKQEEKKGKKGKAEKAPKEKAKADKVKADKPVGEFEK